MDAKHIIYVYLLYLYIRTGAYICQHFSQLFMQQVEQQNN